jgi:hypothetical protein
LHDYRSGDRDSPLMQPMQPAKTSRCSRPQRITTSR